MAPALLKAVTLATCVKAFLLPGIAPHDYQPGAGPKSNAKRDRGARAARRAQIDPPVGGRDSRLHGLGRARRRARRGRGGLPRVAQVPRVHLRADQVRLGRRVPFPLPRPCKRGFPTRRSGRPRSLPRRRRGVVFGTGNRLIPEKCGLKFNSLVVLHASRYTQTVNEREQACRNNWCTAVASEHASATHARATTDPLRRATS